MVFTEEELAIAAEIQDYQRFSPKNKLPPMSMGTLAEIIQYINAMQIGSKIDAINCAEKESDK